MKNIFAIFIIFSCSLTNAQFNDGTVYLKDSTELKGLIRIKSLGGINFRTTKDSENTFYDFNQIIGFDTDNQKYRYIKYQDEVKPRLLKELTKGKISLYSNEVYTPRHTIPNGFPGGGTGMTFGGGSSTIYYMSINDKLIRVGPKLKKEHLEFFKNCPTLMEKIENKFFNKRDVREIINYYSLRCDR